MPKPSTKTHKTTKTTSKSAKPKSTTKIVQKKQPSVAPVSGEPRRLKNPQVIWYKPLTWWHQSPPTYKPLPKARLLFIRTIQQLWQYKQLFGGIAVLYGVLNLLLVRSVAGSNNLSNLKTVLSSLTHGFTGKVITSAGSFVYLLSTSGSGNGAGSGIYQSLLLLVCSLAFIWAFRQTLANHQVQIRDSFYRGMYPLVPFLLMFLLLGVQLLPLVLGGSLYSVVTLNGIAAHVWERGLWLGLFIGLGFWSLRMITASLFALYIVTLPDMTPLRAYRSARQLVYRRRLMVWRKIIFLPVALLVLALMVELPLIFYATPVAPWAFFVLSMITLPVVHGYLYNLYREML